MIRIKSLVSKVCLPHEEIILYHFAQCIVVVGIREKQEKPVQITGCTNISIYPLAIAVSIFLYDWSVGDMSCLLTDPGSLVQTKETQSVELSIQCLWLVKIMHTVENSVEGTSSLYSSISLISTPSPVCSFTKWQKGKENHQAILLSLDSC